VIFVARKGQKFKTYSFELKKKAVEMRLQGIPKAKIAEELGIQDVGRLKILDAEIPGTGRFWANGAQREAERVQGPGTGSQKAATGE